MRKLRCILVTLFSTVMLSGCASLFGAKAPEEQRLYEQIGEFDGQSKDDLFVKVNAWFVDQFNDPESVIQYSDKDAGKVMGKYVFTYSEGLYEYAVLQTMSVDVQEGRIRLQIRDPQYKVVGDIFNGSTPYINNQYRPMETQAGINHARAEWKSLYRSLEESLRTDTSW